MNAEEVAKETVGNEFYMGERVTMARAVLVAIEALDQLSKRSTYYGDDATSCEAALATAREALAKIRGEKP